MPKLYIICGHGDGDPGACSHGYSEAERVRALGKRIKALGGSNVVLMDISRNWYADKGLNTYKFQKGAKVLELHLDSATPSAKGGHIIIKDGYAADKYDKKLSKFIGKMFPGRAQLIVKRGNLANVNRAAARGINYRLMECCFITNSSDIKRFNSKLDKVATGILDSFGILAKTEKEKIKMKKVRVISDTIKIRKGPGKIYKKVDVGNYGEIYTIVKIEGNWGKLKSGAGWIYLKKTERI